jgi:hypothetical protein
MTPASRATQGYTICATPRIVDSGDVIATQVNRHARGKYGRRFEICRTCEINPKCGANSLEVFRNTWEMCH